MSPRLAAADIIRSLAMFCDPGTRAARSHQLRCGSYETRLMGGGPFAKGRFCVVAAAAVPTIEGWTAANAAQFLKRLRRNPLTALFVKKLRGAVLVDPPDLRARLRGLRGTGGKALFSRHHVTSCK